MALKENDRISFNFNNMNLFGTVKLVYGKLRIVSDNGGYFKFDNVENIKSL